MRTFMDEDFLLRTHTARRLYFDFASEMPIYDYHCHINPAEIVQNKAYENITQAWLYGDHYKWRAMRTCGVPEELCTGPANDYSRFIAYAGALPYMIGNPLYHWSHLELKRCFGIGEVLTTESAPSVWQRAKEQLGEDGLRCRDFISMFNVKLICTTDDPVDDLAAHRALGRESLDYRVLPAFRPDKALDIANPGFADYIAKLSAVCDMPIRSLDDLYAALERRIEFFAAAGCKLSDHGMESVPYAEVTHAEADRAFAGALRGEAPDARMTDGYKAQLMRFLGEQYARRGFSMQLHIQAMRGNNTRLLQKLGPDTGFDSIADHEIARPLSRLLDSMEKNDALPRTILYSLNPADTYVLGSMLGNFQGSLAGKVQLGSAWWFNDTMDGMRDQLRAVGNLSVLGHFVGMLTDSRSFLSYTRHEYFRRIFCDLIGGWVEAGEYPNDMSMLETIVRGVCYNNALAYFGM